MLRFNFVLLIVLMLWMSMAKASMAGTPWIQGWRMVALSGSLIVQVGPGEGPVHVSLHSRSGGRVRLLDPAVAVDGARQVFLLWRARKSVKAGQFAISIWSTAEAARTSNPDPPYSEAMLETTGWLSSARFHAGQSGPPTGTIELVATSFATDKGQARIGVFNSKETFLKANKHYLGAVVPVVNLAATHLFENLPYGVYTVGVFQDVDGDEKFSTNFFGAPMEPYGISNNARRDGGYPLYEDASFGLHSPRIRVEIRVR